MRRPSGEKTLFPMVPRVEKSRSGAAHSPDGPLRVALRRLRRSPEAHTARSPSGDRLAKAGGITSCSGGLDQLGSTCAAGGFGLRFGVAAPAAGSATAPQVQIGR